MTGRLAAIVDWISWPDRGDTERKVGIDHGFRDGNLSTRPRLSWQRASAPFPALRDKVFPQEGVLETAQS